MTMAVRYRHAYRSLIREARKLESSTRDDAKRDIVQHFRAALEGQRRMSTVEKLIGDAENAALFLRSQRTYKELLDRYNPLHDMSQEERTQATARRVGLDMPIEAKSDSSEDK